MNRATLAALALACCGATAASRPSPRPSPSVATEVRAAFLGDSGTGDAIQRRVRDQLLRHLPRLVFFLGDNVYSAGQTAYFGPRFNDMYKPLRDNGAECHAVLGNHDVLFCGLATTRGPLSPRADAYRIRDRGCDVDDQLAEPAFGYRGRRRYYSIVSDAGVVPLLEVFALDSNTLGISDTKLWPAGDDWAQVNWLDAVLSGSKARWKVVALHHPPHSPQAERYVFTIRNIKGRLSRRRRWSRRCNDLHPALLVHHLDADDARHKQY